MNDLMGPSRRDFLKTTAIVSGGLVIAFVVPGAECLSQPGTWPRAQCAGRARAEEVFALSISRGLRG